MNINFVNFAPFRQPYPSVGREKEKQCFARILNMCCGDFEMCCEDCEMCCEDFRICSELKICFEEFGMCCA